MKLAIVSTTIHGEKGYLAFDRLAVKSSFSQICFIISGDLNSCPFDVSPFHCEIEYLDAKSQQKYHCSEPMGWRKIMRRNIALLRAIEKRPDYILMIDDDNIPSDDFFEVWYKTVTTPVPNVVQSNDAGGPFWHNYLETSDAAIEIYPRGFPIDFRYKHYTKIIPAKTPIPNERIGVYQGISLGDPDIDAMTRIVYPQPIDSIKKKNYCLKDIWSPYNTQNTMFSPILFPLAFVWPHCGRYDDIYSSFAWQKLLFNRGMYAFVGEAVNHQNRGSRNILKDFDNEVEGYIQSRGVWEEINKISAYDAYEFIQTLSRSEHNILARHRNFMLAWLKDLKSIL